MSIKKILKSSITAYFFAGLLAMPMAFAADNGNNPPNAATPANSSPNSILNKIKSSVDNNGFAFNTLSRKIDAILVSTMESNANLMYQFDSYLSETDNTSTHVSQINQLVQSEALNKTGGNIEAKLAEVPFTIIDPSKNNAIYENLKRLLNQQGGTTQRNRIKKLANTAGIDTIGFTDDNNQPASLFSLPGVSSAAQMKKNDRSYNVDSLILPQSYSTNAERKAATNFITYLSKNYKLSNSVDLSPLKDNTKKLQALKNTVQYQNYLVANRSNIAAASIPLSNLNHIYSERVKLEDIINNMEANGQPVNNTLKNVVKTLANNNINSLLELQNYVATHRLTDQKWREKMLSASPATVQRETLFVLAEIESQLQRLHLDNERLLTTESAAQLQMTQATMLQNSEAKNLQSYIDQKYGSTT